MKFVHISDLHLDTPFRNLNEKGNYGKLRRMEQRDAIRKVISYCKNNEIDYLFIAGDLYENDYIKLTSVDFLNDLFLEIPNTKIYISPGNHDPYLKNSIYATYDFPSNVYIFKNEEIEKISNEDVNIYGAAFTKFYKNEINLDNIKLDNKINILLLHCDLNGSKDSNGFSYCPVNMNKLSNLNFNYIALGHIHKTNFNKNANIIYPGSLISLGFDELDRHGMIAGEILNGKLTIEYIELEENKYEMINIDISEISNEEELIENINSLFLEDNKLYRLNLVGKRNFIINIEDILDFCIKKNLLKVKDCSTINIDIDEILKENSLRSIFIEEVLNKAEKEGLDKEQVMKAIELGLEVM